MFALTPVSFNISLAISIYFFSSTALFFSTLTSFKSSLICSNSFCIAFELLSVFSSFAISVSNLFECLLISEIDVLIFATCISKSLSFFSTALYCFICSCVFPISADSCCNPSSSSLIFFLPSYISVCLNLKSIGCVQVGQLSFFSKNSTSLFCFSSLCSIFVSNLSNSFSFLNTFSLPHISAFVDMIFSFSNCNF